MVCGKGYEGKPEPQSGRVVILMMHARASCKQGRRLMNGTIFSMVWTTDSIPNFHTIDRSLGLACGLPPNASFQLVHEVVSVGSLSPNFIHLPGIHEDCIGKVTAPERSESHALASPSALRRVPILTNIIFLPAELQGRSTRVFTQIWVSGLILVSDYPPPGICV